MKTKEKSTCNQKGIILTPEQKAHRAAIREKKKAIKLNTELKKESVSTEKRNYTFEEEAIDSINNIISNLKKIELISPSNEITLNTKIETIFELISTSIENKKKREIKKIIVSISQPV